jgi:hypothetical protein
VRVGLVGFALAAALGATAGQGPTLLAPGVVSTGDSESHPTLSPDGHLVFAARGRPDSLGSYDFYVTFQCQGAWTAPRPLAGGVNSSAWDFAPRFSPDGATFLFASARMRTSTEGPALRGREGYRRLLEGLRSPGNGLFDIYTADTAALGLADPCPGR